MEADDIGLTVTVALDVQRGQLRFGRAWPQLARRLGLDPGLAGVGPSGLQEARQAERPPGSGSEPARAWTLR